MSGGPKTGRPASFSEIFSLSERETFDIGEALGRRLVGGETVILEGELGAGKTVFVRGIASGLGIDPAEVGSPTFILVDRYAGRVALYHADLYRIEDEAEILDLGLEDFAAAGAVVVVEWGERMPAPLRSGALRVRILDLGEEARRILLDDPS